MMKKNHVSNFGGNSWLVPLFFPPRISRGSLMNELRAYENPLVFPTRMSHEFSKWLVSGL